MAVQRLTHRGQRLRLALDYGTTTASMAYQIVWPGPNGKIFGDTPSIICFTRNEKELIQEVAYSNDGEKFFWDEALRNARRDEEITEENIVRTWKLLLYETHEDSDIVRRIESQLQSLNVTLDRLIADHLKAMLNRAKELIKRDFIIPGSSEKIDELPVELFLSVPQMWKAPANKRMSDAARGAMANLVRVEIVYEPQCVAAWARKNKLVLQQMKKGDRIVVGDLGGGTADFVSYEVQQKMRGDKAGKYRLIKTAKGALCGGEYVNENFRQYVKAQADREGSTFEEKCVQLGRSPASVLSDLSEQFESRKITLDRYSTTSVLYCFVSGVSGTNPHNWSVKIDYETMLSFFRPVISGIKDCFDEQLEGLDPVKVLVVTGKFGRSHLLSGGLTKTYEDDRDIQIVQETEQGNYPVTLGALDTYLTVENRDWQPNQMLGISRQELFDKDRHHDALMFRNTPQQKVDTDIVKKDEFGLGEDWVHHRWCSILRKGENGELYVPKVYEWRVLPINKKGEVTGEDREVELQIYWTENRMNDGDPMSTGGHNSRFKPGIYKWGTTHVFKLPEDLHSRGFKREKRANQPDGYYIYFRIAVKNEPPNMMVMIHLVHPDTIPFYDKHTGELIDHHVQIFEELHAEGAVFEGAFNPGAHDAN